MYRLPAFGIVTVTGPASRSNTAWEYNVSRFWRITEWWSIDATSRLCVTLPSAPFFTSAANVVSDSARRKLSGVTRVGTLRFAICRLPVRYDIDGDRARLVPVQSLVPRSAATYFFACAR